MRKKLLIEVRGKNHNWLFECDADSKYLDEWRADGLEIHVLENTVPMWVVDLGLVRPWVFLQDIFNFKNPFC